MDQQYFVYEYITDEHMNRIGIKFRHILETNPTGSAFTINVGKFYTIYYRKNRTDGRVIKVVRIADGGIYYKVVNDYTDSGEISKYVTNMRLGTEEIYMPMISISGSEMEPPSVYFTLHKDVDIHEGGRKKRGKKSKKYSKTKSKSRTRRGGRRSRRGATKKKYKKARKY
jgi:hypothetical protein